MSRLKADTKKECSIPISPHRMNMYEQQKINTTLRTSWTTEHRAVTTQHLVSCRPPPTTSGYSPTERCMLGKGMVCGELNLCG